MRRWSLTLTFCFVVFTTIPAFAGAFTIGSPADSGTGNCYPFGCAYSGEYQQVYDQGQFPGLVTITGLQFFNTQSNESATAMNSGNWAISLSTTSADWNTLSGTYAANIGADNTQVFNGNLTQAWAFGDTLSIIFSAPFTYNPAGGNLLMDVVVTGASEAGGTIYFDTNGWNGGSFNGNTFLGRVYTDGNVDNGYGLVTGFTTGAGIPEPSALFLVGAGLGLVGLRNARRNRRVQG